MAHDPWCCWNLSDPGGKFSLYAYIMNDIKFFRVVFVFSSSVLPCRLWLWHWHPEDDPDGEVAAFRDGADRGPVQVCLHGRPSLHWDGKVPASCWPGECKTKRGSVLCVCMLAASLPTTSLPLLNTCKKEKQEIRNVKHAYFFESEFWIKCEMCLFQQVFTRIYRIYC